MMTRLFALVSLTFATLATSHGAVEIYKIEVSVHIAVEAVLQK